MPDLKKLAMGRKGFTKKANAKPTPTPEAKTLEQSSAEEIGEAESAFRNRLAREDKRRRVATDSEFWFAVYFQTREAKDAFLRKHGLNKIGDKYLDGRAVDRVLEGRSALSVRDSHRERR